MYNYYIQNLKLLFPKPEKYFNQNINIDKMNTVIHEINYNIKNYETNLKWDYSNPLFSLNEKFYEDTDWKGTKSINIFSEDDLIDKKKEYLILKDIERVIKYKELKIIEAEAEAEVKKAEAEVKKAGKTKFFAFGKTQ
mgnify:CR=1 FL=1